MIQRSLGNEQLRGAGGSGWLRRREGDVVLLVLHLPVPKGAGERSPDRSSQGLASRAPPHPSAGPGSASLLGKNDVCSGPLSSPPAGPAWLGCPVHKRLPHL